MEARKVPVRKDGRIIIHFDYDCFYASVFEAKNPSLKSLPFAVQQKQIIVTCNYEARRRGLHKLQLIKDARRICPDVIIELGEDISRFRDASKELYSFIKSFSWNSKIERLGFDEVWMDVSDLVDYNMECLNRNDLENGFFQMSKEDPTIGFEFNASDIAGHAYPKEYQRDPVLASVDELTLRLRLGSHLALHIRHELEQRKGYTSTVGISTTKLASKLVGNLNKPKGQTTVMPPLAGESNNLTTFMDNHEIGKVPGIGFKLAQKLRELALQRPAEFDNGLVYGGTKEKVTVRYLRINPDVNPDLLEKMLAGPGSPHGIGYKIWCLLHGVDDSEVRSARAVPRQISIEDSYIRLDTMSEVLEELTTLARSLLNRMRIDLLGTGDDFDDSDDAEKDGSEPTTIEPKLASVVGKKWLAHPKTLRLTTRPRQPLQPDGTRIRSFKRISHSAPLPNFVFNLHEHVDFLADKLVKEALVGMFRKLHPEKAGWNLSLVNLAVTNMAETAGDSKTANGRDIGTMFRKQDDVLKDFRVTDMSPPDWTEETFDTPDETAAVEDGPRLKTVHSSPVKGGIEEAQNVMFNGDEENGDWDDGDAEDMNETCGECGLRMPAFAMVAHVRFHLQEAAG